MICTVKYFHTIFSFNAVGLDVEMAIQMYQFSVQLYLFIYLNLYTSSVCLDFEN